MKPMTEDALPASIREARARLRAEEESALLRAMVASTTSFSPSAEQVSTWFLGAAGAGAALFLPNIQTITNTLGVGGARACLLLLVLSMLFGMIAKWLGMFVQYQRSITDTFMPAIPRIYAEYSPRYDDILRGTAHMLPRANIAVLMNVMLQSTPWILRWRMRRGMLKGARDPLLIVKQAFNRFHWQMFCVFIQAITFILSVVAAGFFL